jgi:hypothetical protein
VIVFKTTGRVFQVPASAFLIGGGQSARGAAGAETAAASSGAASDGAAAASAAARLAELDGADDGRALPLQIFPRLLLAWRSPRPAAGRQPRPVRLSRRLHTLFQLQSEL